MKYQPHDYQNYATQFIIDHPVAAILLQMGLGKSVITLTAIQKLLASREVYRVLVIAPLRVARDTWPAEIQKWDHLRGLTYSVAVGTEAERRAALMLDANIHIINRENVQWLIENSHIPFEYDMIVIDELSSFKSHQSKRFKSLMKQRHRVRRNTSCWTWASAWAASSHSTGRTSSCLTSAAMTECIPGSPARALNRKSTGASATSPSA